MVASGQRLFLDSFRAIPARVWGLAYFNFRFVKPPHVAGSYVVVIDDDPDSIITVDGVDMTLAEDERLYPNAVVVDIGARDATHAT